MRRPRSHQHRWHRTTAGRPPSRRGRWRGWPGLLALALAFVLGLPFPPLLGWATASQPTPSFRKVPGPSPAQTIQRFTALTGGAETVIREAIREGMAQPGLHFSAATHERVNKAVTAMQQATEALDLSQMPVALRPMSGVGNMLMLRSLLNYDLHQNPDLAVPNQAQTEKEHLKYWTIPDSPITLKAISNSNPDASPANKSCSQCSNGDFLFTAETLNQVPADFDAIFGNQPALRHRFGADLYTYWALLPGGTLPPKAFFLLPKSTRHVLLTTIGGQSLLQWLLLIPVSAACLAVMVWWLYQVRRWHLQHAEAPGPGVHLLRCLGLLPPLLLVWAWQAFAIDWINLIGPRQEVVLMGTSVAYGVLLALMTYLVAEAVGQLIVWQRLPASATGGSWVRRKGSGQIMTLARTAGLVGAVVAVIRTGQSLGLTSVTLLALSSVPALAISLGTQQLIHDVADGFSLLLDGQIKPGDPCTIGTAKSGEIRGRITSLGMRSVRLQQDDGSVLSIPNSQVASSVVTKPKHDASHGLKLSLPIPDLDPTAVQRHLEQGRQLLTGTPDLQETDLKLEAGSQGWQLTLKGQWNPELSSKQRKAAQEGLMLQLLQLINSPTPAPGDHPSVPGGLA